MNILRLLEELELEIMTEIDPPPAHEPEWRHSGWKHPYVIYILLTGVLFLFLILMGWIAYHNGWIPNRGINAQHFTAPRSIG